MINRIDPVTTRRAAADWLARGKPERALSSVLLALRGDPRDVQTWIALGIVYRALARWDEAVNAFSQALRLSPDDPTASTYLGMILLGLGRFREGWAAYRARWGVSNWPDRMRYPAGTLWDGVPRAGLRLLLWCEQGFGDAIQFARYAPWLQSLGMAVTLEAPIELRPLFAQSWPQLGNSSESGRFDAHLPIMDLPAAWRGGPLLALPQASPYLRLDTQPRLAASDRMRVGIVWAGRPSHPDDRLRSIPVSLLQSLISTARVDWIALQKDAAVWPDGVVRSLAPDADFLETARVIARLDLVVTVDTAVAHLAGALGKPVWVMLPFVPDWRWMLEREDSPWYPTMRLFRQTDSRDWSEVLARVATALRRLQPVPGDPPAVPETHDAPIRSF
jgi:hypothetical protein